MTFRLAVVSDLHCHPTDKKPQQSFLLSDGLRSPPNEHPVESLKRAIAVDGLTVDVMLAPGDFTDQINRQGLVSGWEFVKEIGTALHASLTVSTLGNHDVD